jgi:hypothetical protein
VHGERHHRQHDGEAEQGETGRPGEHAASSLARRAGSAAAPVDGAARGRAPVRYCPLQESAAVSLTERARSRSGFW